MPFHDSLMHSLFEDLTETAAIFNRKGYKQISEEFVQSQIEKIAQ